MLSLRNGKKSGTEEHTNVLRREGPYQIISKVFEFNAQSIPENYIQMLKMWSQVTSISGIGEKVEEKVDPFRNIRVK